MDTVNKATRSKIMASVGQRDTGSEIRLRLALHRLGFRYRLNDRRLPGSPDLVLKKYRAVIFVHGCFWHRHGCKYTTTPSTRKKFWTEKFEANERRDKKNVDSLLTSGWRVLIVWECVVKGGTGDKLSFVVSKVVEWIVSDSLYAQIPR